MGEKGAHPEGDHENVTFLGKSSDFKGTIRFNGTIRVDGRLEGEIHTSGVLIVGEHAVIKGIVSAGTVMTSGKINGTVTAVEQIQILKPGIVIGDIRTPSISIETGSHFHGMCDMGAHKWVDDQPTSNKPIDDLAPHRVKIRAADL
ncbi:MAG: polymer-forming cytoskeletal protein [Nitrospira sp.]|nr:polymer-forming cytoskeletal protein [Nitrospira sp.]